MTATPAEVGTTFTVDGITQVYTVAESCGTNMGQWFCVTHAKAFRNQLEKDNHISSGSHELAWVCLDHGPEAP